MDVRVDVLLDVSMCVCLCVDVNRKAFFSPTEDYKVIRMQGHVGLDRQNFGTRHNFSILIGRFPDGGKLISAIIIISLERLCKKDPEPYTKWCCGSVKNGENERSGVAL